MTRVHNHDSMLDALRNCTDMSLPVEGDVKTPTLTFTDKYPQVSSLIHVGSLNS